MYIINVRPTVDEQKYADYLDYMHRKSMLARDLICRNNDFNRAKLNLEQTIQWLTKK